MVSHPMVSHDYTQPLTTELSLLKLSKAEVFNADAHVQRARMEAVMMGMKYNDDLLRPCFEFSAIQSPNSSAVLLGFNLGSSTARSPSPPLMFSAGIPKLVG